MRVPNVLVVFTSCLLLSANVTADYEKGLAAYYTDDYATAVREWKASAEQGAPDSQFWLGTMYDEGNGVLQDSRSIRGHIKTHFLCLGAPAVHISGAITHIDYTHFFGY